MPARNTVAEGYEAIEKDLTTALGLVSDKVNDGHFNKWAVLGLQARFICIKAIMTQRSIVLKRL